MSRPKKTYKTILQFLASKGDPIASWLNTHLGRQQKILPEGLFVGGLEPFVHMRDDIANAFKPYYSASEMVRDLLQPLYGIGNFVRGWVYIVAAPLLFVPNMIRPSKKEAKKAFSVKTKENWQRSCGWFVDGIGSIIRGVMMVFTAPLTWLGKMPLRGMLTLIDLCLRKATKGKPSEAAQAPTAAPEAAINGTAAGGPPTQPSTTGRSLLGLRGIDRSIHRPAAAPPTPPPTSPIPVPPALGLRGETPDQLQRRTMEALTATSFSPSTQPTRGIEDNPIEDNPILERVFDALVQNTIFHTSFVNFTLTAEKPGHAIDAHPTDYLGEEDSKEFCMEKIARMFTATSENDLVLLLREGPTREDDLSEEKYDPCFQAARRAKNAWFNGLYIGALAQCIRRHETAITAAFCGSTTSYTERLFQVLSRHHRRWGLHSETSFTTAELEHRLKYAVIQNPQPLPTIDTQGLESAASQHEIRCYPYSI